MKKICVYCGSKPGAGEGFLQCAEDLGIAMAKRKLGLVYGGACIGLMGKVADTVLQHGGEVIGVIPADLFNQEVTHTGLTELISVKNMHQRKETMASLSDGFIALPGGFGTFEEVFEAITWSQLKIHIKPIGLLNKDGYYNHLEKFLQHAVHSEFIKLKHKSLYALDADPDHLIDAMLEMY